MLNSASSISSGKFKSTFFVVSSKKFPIEAEINQNRIASGYELLGETVNPSQITITGGQEELNKIAYVNVVNVTKKYLTKANFANIVERQ